MSWHHVKKQLTKKPHKKTKNPKTQLTIVVWVKFCFLNSIPLFYMSTMPISHLPRYCSFAVRFKIRKCDTFNCVLLFQYCSGYIASLALTYTFYGELVNFFKNQAGILLGIAVSLRVHHFTLNLLVFLNLKCVSCRQHIIGSCFLYFTLPVFLMIGMCNLFAFNAVNNKVDFTASILLFIFFMCYVLFALFLH